MENSPDTRFSRPDPSSSEDAIIRNMMMREGTSYDEARMNWEMTKANVDRQILDSKREEEQNG